MIRVSAMYHVRIKVDTSIMKCIRLHYHCITSHVVADFETATGAILIHVSPLYYDRPRLVVFLLQMRVVDTCITSCIISVSRMYHMCITWWQEGVSKPPERRAVIHVSRPMNVVLSIDFETVEMCNRDTCITTVSTTY
jgi:hypothetical protein